MLTRLIRRVRPVCAVVAAPLDVPLAPMLLPWVFRTLVAGVVVAGAILTVLAVRHSWWLGVLVPAATVLAVIVVRVGCELALGFARLTARTAEMAAGLSRVEESVATIAGDMPRLGFLRSRP